MFSSQILLAIFHTVYMRLQQGNTLSNPIFGE